MSSEAQINANRQNAEKSTGPRSPEGKAAVSQNAVKHGLFASQAVVKGENEAEFEAFRDEILAELAPASPVETMLCDRIVSLSWRLKRVERMQNQAIEVMMARDEPSPLTKHVRASLPKFLRALETDPRGAGAELVLGRAVIKDYSNSRVLDRLSLYERRIEHSLFKTMRELRNLRLTRQMQQADAVGAESRVSGGPGFRIKCGMTGPRERLTQDDLKKQSQFSIRSQESEDRSQEREDGKFATRDTQCEIGRRVTAAPSVQNKANFREAEVGVSSLCAKDYENKPAWRLGQNKPKQTQFQTPSR